VATAIRLTAAGLVLAFAAAMVVLPPSVAQAATDVVTSCSGSVSVVGSLPYEVADANPGDTVTFALPPSCTTITPTSTIDISKNLTIIGPGVSTLAVSGGGSIEVLAVTSGTVSISGLTVENGNYSEGGGIYNAGTLSVSDSAVSDDTSSNSGGGILNDGTLTVTDSTLSNDDAGVQGGGISTNFDDTLTVTESTLSDDTAGQNGGGIESNEGTLTVTNSTLAGDTVTTDDGGGVEIYDGSATITNSTLWDNSAPSYYGGSIEDDQGNLTLGGSIMADSPSGDDCFLQFAGSTFTDLGDNLDDDSTCHLTGATDLAGTSAGLDPSGLADNGGPTETIALEPGSAAIDHVSNGSLCPATDQRGAPRSVPCDIGAYDTDWGPAVILDVSGSQTSGQGSSLTYTTNAPPGIVSGTLDCATVDGGTPISPGLATGYYTVDGSSCSGLASSDQAAYPIFPSSYSGVTGGFVVSASPAWVVSPSVNPGAEDNVLDGVSCSGVAFCVAVGYQTALGSQQTLIETWNGTTWSVTSSPDGGGFNALDGVSCWSATSCVAVGFDQSGSTYQTLVESWDGVSWSIVSSLDPGSGDDYLNGVSCISSSSCVAVGFDESGSTDDTLIETLSGGSWSVTSSSDPSGSFNELEGVSCTSATSCVSVGFDAGSVNETLIETLAGGIWSVTSSPSPGSSSNSLNGVSCTSTTSCVAVGTDQGGSIRQTLIETLSGGSWSVTSSPDPGSSSNQLLGVSCSGAASCDAVGNDTDGSTQQTLIESGNGGSWSTDVSTSPGTNDNLLSAISCTTTISCAITGDDSTGSLGDNETLIEMPPPPIVSAVSPDTGLTTGGTTVTITGSGFTGATAVAFDTTPAVIDAESGDTSLTVTVPAGSPGTVDVTVTAPGGISAVNQADGYTYTVAQTPSTVQCEPSCINAVSTTLNDTGVSVSGNSGSSSSGATTTLVVNTATVSCGASKTHDYDYLTAVSTLSDTDFPAGAALTVTETVGNEPSTTGVRVCYAAASSTTGVILHHCRSSMHAPCLESLVESSGSVVATFLSPATDPRFWTGEAAADVTGFSPTKGAPGSTVTIKGKNLSGAIAVVIGGDNAPISSASTDTKLLVTVPPNARTGLITVTAASGEAVSAKPFTVK
jgi:hypothetical protein